MSDEKDMHPDFDDEEDEEAVSPLIESGPVHRSQLSAQELEALKARQAEMEKDAQQLMALQAALSGGSTGDAADGTGAEAGSSSGAGKEGGAVGGESSANGDAPAPPTEEEREEVDARSIYIGNVDYGATPEEIQKHFQACGTINRVTILCDKFTGHPKGFAYVEFADAALVKNALVLNESMFRGRVLQVTAKRTNKPGFNRGRGRGRGGYRGGYVSRGGYAPYRARGRGRGRGY